MLADEGVLSVRTAKDRTTRVYGLQPGHIYVRLLADDVVNKAFVSCEECGWQQVVPPERRTRWYGQMLDELLGADGERWRTSPVATTQHIPMHRQAESTHGDAAAQSVAAQAAAIVHHCLTGTPPDHDHTAPVALDLAATARVTFVSDQLPGDTHNKRGPRPQGPGPRYRMVILSGWDVHEFPLTRRNRAN
ncbi:hypothetical protein [Streptomyces sp. NPDC049915]|uniref:hypothetical protein n=1 Tax=Streptomyces sp. NPDC049915 TaxID=3155510 RepID=UPI0034181C4F